MLILNMLKKTIDNNIESSSRQIDLKLIECYLTQKRE